ncbi:MAG: hypothetical protein HY784_15260 [Chloroflexi bacterium]|nr:hypothetical protein [Chloroflexota bacterium]
MRLAFAGGGLVAQSVAVPAGWTRPTTGWLAGEYIVDEHRVALPAGLASGPLRLFVGLYDPATGVRLLTGQGERPLLVTLDPAR